MSFASTKRLAHLSVVTCSLAYAVAATGCSASSEETTPGTGAPAPEETGASAPGGSDPGAPSSSGGSSTPAPAQPAGPPHVLSTLPADAASGVRSDAKVVIKFDRAMDTDSVISAYASLALPADKVAFDWNAVADELTVTPASPLAYATGGPQIGPNGYSITIAKSAKAKDGVPMADDFSLSFTTLRRIAVHPPKVDGLSGRVFSNGTTAATLTVGDVYSSGAEHQSKAFLTFDLTEIPDGAEIEKASFSAEEFKLEGKPDSTLGGPLAVHHVFFAAIDGDAFAAEPMSEATVKRSLVLNGPATRTAITTAMVQDDFANRVVRDNRSQIRFAYPTAVSGDNAHDYVMLSSVDLSILYLVP